MTWPRLTNLYTTASDAGSVYEPFPVLSLKWDPEGHIEQRPYPFQSGSSFPLGPHPADPHPSDQPSPVKADGDGFPGPNAQYHQIPGKELWVYEGAAGYFSNFIKRATHLTWRTVPTLFGVLRSKFP